MTLLTFGFFTREEYLGESLTRRGEEYWGFQTKSLPPCRLLKKPAIGTLEMVKVLMQFLTR